MKKILFIAGLAFLASCSNQQTSTEQVAEEIVKTTTHGIEISEDGAIGSAEFFAQIEDKDSIDVKLAANITEVCSKKGCWMKLDMGDGKTMRVTFKDYGFFVPKDAAGKEAVLQGIAKIDTVDIATLKHYAEDANKSQADIDAITEPEISYSFEAVGVIIKEDKSASI